MAKQKGFIKLKGSLGGLTFYSKDGKELVRTTGGVEKSRIMKDPAFKRTRENMAEFGASATIGKALRLGLANVIKSMGGNSIVGRITGLMKRVNFFGAGLRGQRSFEFLTNKEVLEGFEFNKEAPLGAIFYAPSDPPVLDANRNEITWTVPDFSTDSFINVPEGASHCRLLLVSTVLSNYVYNASTREFEATNPSENGTNEIAFSPYITLGGGMVGVDTILTNNLGFAAALPATVAVVNAVGIIFYQEVNGQHYELASDNAMRIELVG